MPDKINTHLEKLEQSIEWVKLNLKGEKMKETYSKLIDSRRKLNNIKFALMENPAAAMYGESQVGKSYLGSGLLSTPGTPFEVIDPNGKKYNFIKEINPIGKGTESTSLITRFSLNCKSLNDEYPVKIKLLSVSDMVLLLCDTYYNDIKAHKFLNTEELNEEIRKLEESVVDKNTNQNIITEDDILEIRDYFKNQLKSKSPFIEGSLYFDKVSLIISRFETHEWVTVFSILWNRNRYFSDLFNELLHKYKEIDFVTELYVPYSTVLRDFGTLLDVDRINELSGIFRNAESNFKPDTSIIYFDKKGGEKVKTIEKSYLCAMSAEVVFKLPVELQSSKPFLEKTDLLDFPGARARWENYEDDITPELMPQMFLRGKVAYLFNKYSTKHLINTLLFCHHNIKSEVKYLPELLNRWIGNFVGDSPEARQKFINSSLVPPLFIIGTKFNLDLKYDQHDTRNNPDSLNNRWAQRFNKALEVDVINIETYEWLNNWSSNQVNFQNIYLLRDYYYSSEDQNQIYRGYISEKKELEEIIPAEYPEFRNDLRESFLQYEFVKKHFEAPEMIWDKVANMNQDGTDLIIEKLSIAAENINPARKEKFIFELNDISKQVISELDKHYHSGNTDEMLQKAKETAGVIQQKIQIQNGRDPFFFAKLMQLLVINEAEIYSLYHDKIHSLELTQNVNIEEYNGLRLSNPELSSTNDFETNVAVLQKKYEYTSAAKCKEAFANEGIDLHELFYGNKYRMLNYSDSLALALKNYWFEDCLKGKNFKGLCDLLFESNAINLIGMFKKQYEKLHIGNKIAERLLKYANGIDNSAAVQEMIADMSAEIINKFVTTVGYVYFSEENIREMEIANTNHDLGIKLNHDYLAYDNFSTQDVVKLFDVLDQFRDLMNQNPLNHEILKNVPSYSNFKKWNDLLKVGFVSVCKIPNYDIPANERLEQIMTECNQIYYESI